MGPFRAAMLAAAALSLSSLTIPHTLAQTPPSARTINVSGIVRDLSGAAIAGAAVTLQDQASTASLEAKTAQDGTFSFLVAHPGTYVVRARMQGFKDSVSGPLDLSPGKPTQLTLVMNVASGGGVMVEPSPIAQPSASKLGDPQFDDQPGFTVAGVTDWTSVGGHGSDTKLRTSESLAKETAALKSSQPGEASSAVSASSREADFHRVAGDRAESSGDPLAAVREYEQAARLDPSEQNFVAWGTELLLHRAVKPAVEVFEKGTAAHPKSARMLAGFGAALYAAGSYADAASRVCAASDLQPADPTPYLFLGKMEKAAPDPLPCVERKLARFAHDQPAAALANYYYAVALWKESRNNEKDSGKRSTVRQVEALLQKAIGADPKLTEAYLQLGAVYAAQEEFPQAISAYQKAIEVNPQSGEAHYRLALAYKRTGENEKSERELQLFKQADKTETAAIEQQRREIRQFLIILKDQPQPAATQPQHPK
jgi:tetratricopeptide (TPR) repeat protein